VPNQDEQADPADDEHVSDVEDGPVVQVNESGPRLGALRLWRAPIVSRRRRLEAGHTQSKHEIPRVRR